MPFLLFLSSITTSLLREYLVDEKGWTRVDYIKTDIEGSELKALQGAEKTIRTHKPRLAIALYHRDDDFVVIPDYLRKLSLGYDLFLDHFTILWRGDCPLCQSKRVTGSLSSSLGQLCK